MDSSCNPICATCPTSYNSVNGRRCAKFNIHVEYAKEPYCETQKRNQDENK